MTGERTKDAAAEAGLNAIKKRAKELRAKTERLMKETSITQDIEEQADKITEAYIVEIMAEATEAAAEAYAKAYKAAKRKEKKQ